MTLYQGGAACFAHRTLCRRTPVLCTPLRWLRCRTASLRWLRRRRPCRPAATLSCLALWQDKGGALCLAQRKQVRGAGPCLRRARKGRTLCTPYSTLPCLPNVSTGKAGQDCVAAGGVLIKFYIYYI